MKISSRSLKFKTYLDIPENDDLSKPNTLKKQDPLTQKKKQILTVEENLTFFKNLHLKSEKKPKF